MILHTIQIGDIKGEDTYYLQKLDELIARIPQELSPLVSCHTLCRFFTKCCLIKPRVVDGYFARRANQHSWCVIRSSGNILDCYPIAGSRPFVVVGEKYLLWHSLYVPARLDIDHKKINENVMKLREWYKSGPRLEW
jgi:hypothetical protein